RRGGRAEGHEEQGEQLDGGAHDGPRVGGGATPGARASLARAGAAPWKMLGRRAGRQVGAGAPYPRVPAAPGGSLPPDTAGAPAAGGASLAARRAFQGAKTSVAPSAIRTNPATVVQRSG